MTSIFPHIKRIVIPPVSSNQVQIKIWTIDPKTERYDLTIPLCQCGTGIGQVLAILYVAITSDYPRPIIIDEPQSFLHPGAVRKLFSILQQDYSQHQYIITTHSPIALISSNPHTIFLVKREESESKVEEINASESRQLRSLLSEVGARLSDVFGVDNILWVEGQTEELCFPKILTDIAKQPLLGTAVIGVMQTGDFEGKHSKTILDIYTRLTHGKGLLPPATGFIFDQEDRTKQHREDLERQSKGAVTFLPRRMYENYLLNPDAISSVVSNIEGFRGREVTVQEITDWIQRNQWNNKYITVPGSEYQKTDSFWIENVNGAKLLNGLFQELSENRIDYDKIQHSFALTEWIIENNPDDLKEIVDLLKSILQRDMTI